MNLADLRAIPTDDFISKKAADDKTQLYEALHKGVNGTAQHTVDGYVFTNESVDLLRPGRLMASTSCSAGPRMNIRR